MVPQYNNMVKPNVSEMQVLDVIHGNRLPLILFIWVVLEMKGFHLMFHNGSLVVDGWVIVYIYGFWFFVLYMYIVINDKWNSFYIYFIYIHYYTQKKSKKKYIYIYIESLIEHACMHA